VNNITALYQEWLNIGDKVFVELFESDEYSQLMAEVSAIQMKLRKEYETQIEKSMSGFPIATKSELDELYKTIYDLKKEVRQLVKMLDLNNNEEPAQNETNETASAKNTNAKKSTPKK